MRTLRNLAVYTLLVFGLMAAVQMAPAMKTLQPQELLAAAPIVPPEWKKITSRAKTKLTGIGQIICTAERDYEVEVPVKNAPPGTPAKKVKVTINFGDTGSDSQVAAPSSGGKTLTLHGNAGTLVESGPNSTTIEIMIPPRLRLFATIDDLPNADAEDLFQEIDPSPFYNVAQKLPTEHYPDARYTLSLYDEINPSSNRSYEQGISVMNRP